MSTAELASPPLMPLPPAALAKMLPPDHYLSELWLEREPALLHLDIHRHFTPMEPVAAHFCQLMQQRLAAAGFL
ncbi:hypothetical protein GCM10011297_34610 [Bacterioplanes sanyensis]|uniref:hypothetical protein n=1 Tax=Bacterioplanes sanyensis TaxID=1249553 RepID=UPI0016726332|nr:hypothetical protein [Bacterioplanes sanyensis]GGY59071.1 hypothetical protein GCM10011297_34610 [Bacterioplanes sanyensis]